MRMEMYRELTPFCQFTLLSYQWVPQIKTKFSAYFKVAPINKFFIHQENCQLRLGWLPKTKTTLDTDGFCYRLL